MNIRDKLDMQQEIDRRNDERIDAYMRTTGVHMALEIHANAVIDSLDIIAERYALKRSDLLEVLISTLYATEQVREQEEKSHE